MKWTIIYRIYYLVDDKHEPHIAVEYNKVTRMWGWWRYGVGGRHDMPGVRSADEARAVALAQWRMEL